MSQSDFTDFPQFRQTLCGFIIWRYHLKLWIFIQIIFQCRINWRSTKFYQNKSMSRLHTKINAIGPCLGIQTASLLANTFLIPVQNGSTFVYSEKATKFCKISSLLLSTVHTDKIRWRFRKLLWPFSEYMNFAMFIKIVRTDQFNVRHLF